MKKSELKALIRETIEELYNEDFAPLGVAEEKEDSPKYLYAKSKSKPEPEGVRTYKGQKYRYDKIPSKPATSKITFLNEKAPPDFPKALHDKLLKQYKDDESKAYATMWKIFHAKNSGNKRVDEMWMAFEGKEMDKKHDETDMSNPEEKREVELARKAREAADAILKMHGK